MKKALLHFYAFFIGIIQIVAQSAGPVSPGSYAISGTGANWGNLSGVTSIDNNPAYADLAQYPTCNSSICYYSNIAHFTGFGFSIPLTATISGIMVNAMQRVSSPGGGIRDSVVFLSFNGTVQGSNKADSTYWQDTPTMNIYGNAADIWGYAWTPAEVNDATFGIQFQVTNDSYDQPASLDFLSMTVYYQTGTGIGSQTSTPWEIGFFGKSLGIRAESTILSKGVVIEVHNLDGKLQYKESVNQSQGKLDLNIDASAWSDGVYLINVIPIEGSTVRRKALLVK